MPSASRRLRRKRLGSLFNETLNMSSTTRYGFEKERGLPRREFLRVAGAGLGSLLAINAGAECAWADALDKPTAAKPLLGQRVLTFNTVIRVNQIEATRAWSADAVKVK